MVVSRLLVTLVDSAMSHRNCKQQHMSVGVLTTPDSSSCLSAVGILGIRHIRVLTPHAERNKETTLTTSYSYTIRQHPLNAIAIE